MAGRLEDIELTYKLQPIVMIADQRIDCSTCGALATIATVDNEANNKFAAWFWCQSCYTKACNEEEDSNHESA